MPRRHATRRRRIERCVGPGYTRVKPPPGYQSWNSYFNGRSVAPPPPPYKSWLEFRVFVVHGLPDTVYEADRVEYMSDRVRWYLPDGVHADGVTLYEVKGRFRTKKEMAKYLSIQLSRPDKRIVFIFARPGVPVPNAKPRGDGTIFTHEEWARRHGFGFVFEDDLCRHINSSRE